MLCEYLCDRIFEDRSNGPELPCLRDQQVDELSVFQDFNTLRFHWILHAMNLNTANHPDPPEEARY